MSTPFPPSLLSPTSPNLSHNARAASPNYFAFPVDSNTTTIDANGSPKTKHWGSIDAGTSPGIAVTPRPLPHTHKSFTAPSDQKSTISLSSLAFPLSLPGTPKNRIHSPSTHQSTNSNISKPNDSASQSRARNASSSSEQKLKSPKSPKRMLSTDATTIDDVYRQAADGSPRFPRTNSNEGSVSSISSASSSDRDLTKGSSPKRIGLDRRGSSKDSFGKTSPLSTVQDAADLLESGSLSVLILDLRVSTMYAKSHIKGALNLCVPTTLLKRPSYTVEKLADTFNSNPEHKARFERWQEYSHILVYDSAAAHIKDSPNCTNILKKFENANFHGETHLLVGGYEDFERKHADHTESSVNHTTASTASSTSNQSRSPSIPVIGGCPLPQTDNAANPFFSNIRQNTDLIGGVGQFPVRNLAQVDSKKMPRWLAKASKESDNGKLVSEKFLHIEQREQCRMQDALCTRIKYTSSHVPDLKMGVDVQIAGIEKGAKNRYNNIWPFEHSRVKLNDVASSGCDYVNANFIGTKHSRKKYIATQCPLPTTFNDFWNMVWQRDVRVIVMLTAESEGGQIKAHNYWKDNHYGPIKLRSMSEVKKSIDPSMLHKTSGRSSTGSTGDVNQKQYVTVRKFTMTHDKNPFERMREVTQIHYVDWPDFGATAHPADVLGLVEQCNAATGLSTQDTSSQDQKPVLVHCSAGCGRTGTFCTVDTVVDILKQQKRHQASAEHARHLQLSRQTTPMDTDTPPPSLVLNGGGEGDSWLDRDDIDLIEQTVEELRHQRISMVQSLRQYVLCYESILEWIAWNR